MASVLRYDDGGWAERVGNHVALDLVNTVSWRLDPARTVDRLPDAAAVVRWAGFVGVLDEQQVEALSREAARDGRAADRVAADVRRARDRLYVVLHPLATDGRPDAADVEVLQRWVLSVLRRAGLTSVMPAAWATPLDSLDDLPVELGLHAWSLLQHEDHQRLRQCRDAACGWLFLDRSRNGSRVWCSSADCGNRTRARRHYRRHAGAAT